MQSSALPGEEVSSRTLPLYDPPGEVRRILAEGILAEAETPQALLERVVSTIFSVEHEFGTEPAAINKMAEELAGYIVEGAATPGTSTLTNAGRGVSALSSCAVIPVDLQASSDETIADIQAYYKQNMGSGFELTRHADPVAVLSWINDLSAREAATGEYQRYIGNMGMLHVSHPAIKEFIGAKRHREMVHFNISVDVSEEFMRRAQEGETFMLSDGTQVNAADLLQTIAENAWHNGDPGLIYLERMNRDNPVSEMSRYACTPACAEMGLAKGETCHFGYINLRNFVRNLGETVEIDYSRLERVTRLLTRALDNAIQYSIPRYPLPISGDIARQKRKIGIGICGLAELLLAFQLSYDSDAARELARDVLSFINYTSKCASMELAGERGACLAMKMPLMNKYMSGHFLEEKYAKHPTRTVSSGEWEQLARTIRNTGKLRNITTTALPPSGRTSLLLGVTSAIEPLFSIFSSNGKIHSSIVEFLAKNLDDEGLVAHVCQEASQQASFQKSKVLPSFLRECLKTAKELTPLAHVQMVADVAGMYGVVDESASKTVNLPHSATVNEVRDIFLSSYRLGLKNISVYRDKTRVEQPVML